MEKRIDSIQGLRGFLAFLFAYIFHYELLFSAMPVQGTFLQSLFEVLGRMTLYASDIFFILSGYLTCQGYERRIEGQCISLKEYMVPKIRRIYPYVIVTALWNFILETAGYYLTGQYPLHADGGKWRYSLPALVLNIVGMQSGWISEGDSLAVNGPSWFISVLFLCYIIHFFQARYIRKEKIRIGIYWIMVVLGLFLIIYPQSISFLFQVNGRGYMGFFVGILMRYYLDHISETKRNRGVIPAALILAAAVALCATEAIHFMLPEVCLIFPLTVYLAIYGRISRWILNRRALQWLGEISLSLYLCNIPTDTLIAFLDQTLGWKLDYGSMWVWLGHIVFSLLIACGFNQMIAKNMKIIYKRYIHDDI